MKIINWTLAIIIAFNLVACTSGTDNTKKHEVVTKTTSETTQAVTETSTEVAEAITETTEAAGNSTKTQALADAKAAAETAKTKNETPAKSEKTSTSKPKPIVEKVKETAEREVEKATSSTQKAVETVKETAQNTTAAVTETVTKTIEPAKEAVSPPPAPKVETKPAATPPPVVEKPAPKVAEKPIPKPEMPLSHSAWDGLLRKHVSSTGSVNYSGFKGDIGKLQDYLDLLANNTPQSAWGRSKTMAYWINAYNAFTVKLILDNYPLGSITDLEGGKPWSKRWIKLGDKTYTLDQIEKEILLKKYKDGRVHFAVNCAAKSCPALLNQAWTAGNLESNFERQTKKNISIIRLVCQRFWRCKNIHQ